MIRLWKSEYCEHFAVLDPHGCTAACTNVYPAKIETIDEKVFGMEAPSRGLIGGLMGGSLLNALVLKEKKVTITEVVEAYYELKLQGE